MTLKTLEDYSDEQLAELQNAKNELVLAQQTNGIRSVRTTVDTRHDAPVLRVEMGKNFFTNSVHDTAEAHDLVLLSAFATDQNGCLVGIFGSREVLNERREH